MEKKIIFATGNAGKMREIRAILSDLGLPVLSMKEAGVDLDIVEDGKTLLKMQRSSNGSVEADRRYRFSR